jgi:hypothetical protein
LLLPNQLYESITNLDFFCWCFENLNL